MSARWIGSIALGGFLAMGGVAAAQGLGVGRGIDHVASLVRPENFDDQTDVMTRLGFSITPALLSPIGAKNRLIWFGDLSYLEVLTITDSNDFTAPYLAFLEHFEGSPFYGTEVTNADRAIAFLNSAGYPNTGRVPAAPLTVESTGQVVGASPLWNSIILTSRVAPGNANFFLDYDEAEVRRMFTEVPAIAPRRHPNTAEGIETLWLVVQNLDAAIGYYEGLGLKVGSKHKKVRYLGGRGAEVRFGGQTVTLLEPDGPGLVADFAAERGEGILGVSVGVRRLHTALSLVNANTGLDLQSFKDQGRSRFLVPFSLTHGFLISMVQE